MRLLFIAALSICALILDYQIYKHISKRWMRLFYLGYAITVDVLIFVFILLGFHWPFYGIHSISSLPLWFAWFFFFNTIPKIAYFLFYFLSMVFGKWMRLLGIAVALCCAFVLVKGAFYNSRHFEVKQITIESEKIPPSFDGYTIALFSDIHLGNLSRQTSFLHQFVEQINQLQPNLMLHAGDLVNMYAVEITPAVQTLLSQLKAPDGVYSVLGNHDMGVYFAERADKIGLTPLENTDMVVRRQQEMGWKVLQNESVYIRRKSDSIGLCGVPYPPLPPLFPDSLTHFNLPLATHLLDSTRFNIMLCHTPIVWETMRDTPALKRIDLMVSGHTHAMQMKIKIKDLQWSPAKWMYLYWSGLYAHNGRYLYVNEGLGYVLYPMRIGSRPEITLITLQRKN